MLAKSTVIAFYTGRCTVSTHLATHRQETTTIQKFLINIRALGAQFLGKTYKQILI
jgi:hypothetical protein